MKTIFRLTVSMLLSVACASVFAHASLQSSSPKANEVVMVAPTAIVLRFNETLEAPFSRITLINLKSGAVKTTKATVDSAHPQILRLATTPLGVGNYQVQWSTMTQDGHRAKGQFGFQVK